MRFGKSVCAAIYCLTLAAGCGSKNTGIVDNGKAISGVEVVPNEDTVGKGTTKQFHATVRYADGTTKDVTTDKSTVWNTSDPSIATVAEDGTVTTRKPGVVNISATYKGEKGDEHFIVTP